MPHIARALLRRRAEHNEGQLSTLEELTLHQKELEGINEVSAAVPRSQSISISVRPCPLPCMHPPARTEQVLGASCRKLKILYLQNNVIDRIRNLHHLKELEYLNVALNNLTRVEGLRSDGSPCNGAEAALSLHALIPLSLHRPPPLCMPQLLKTIDAFNDTQPHVPTYLPHNTAPASFCGSWT